MRSSTLDTHHGSMTRQVFAIAECVALVAALVVAVGRPAAAQRGGPSPGGAAASTDTTSGFVIRDQMVIAQCSGCHVRDSAGRMQRISYLRKTPEGWETSLRRMVSLNNVKLDPATARAIVRYLSDHQGLAPSELRDRASRC